MPALTIEELTQRERAKELIRAARKMSSTFEHGNTLEKAFEEAGCSCHADRMEMERLKKELKSELPDLVAAALANPESEMHKRVAKAIVSNWDYRYVNNLDINGTLDIPKAKRIAELAKSVQETDQKEHPNLDYQARIAKPFFGIWALDNMTTIMGKPAKQVAEAYATAWIHEGWRPS